jgi:hypothetical protein
MNIEQPVKRDERTVAVAYAANTWVLNFILFALLIDVVCRSAFFNEQPWDLMALVCLSGVISMIYQARHKALVQGFTWKIVVLMFVTALIAAVVSFIFAMLKAK